MIYTLHYNSPLGGILIAEQDHSVIGLWFEGQKYFADSLAKREIEQAQTLVKRETEEVPTEVLEQTAEWLDRYFRGEKPEITELSLAPEGSEFRREVWKLLCDIPYGEVTTYGELARKIADRRGLPGMSAQAVGGAVGHNPISIIIPCHRVVGANGSLTGYAGGLERKRRLLELECQAALRG